MPPNCICWITLCSAPSSPPRVHQHFHAAIGALGYKVCKGSAACVVG